MSGVVLDAGALIALERRDRSVARRLQVTRAHGDPVVIPSGCLAQVWRDGSRQAELAKALKQTGTRVLDLDGTTARRIGELLARTGTSDVIDAQVAFAAMRTNATIVTSDPDDMRRLAPRTAIVEV